MKETTIKLYEYSELSKKAQEYALSKWRETVDDPYMQSHMINLLKEKLEERGVKYNEDSMDVRYSLASCQGDGFMFIGKLEWRGQTITITHGDHHYSHMYTARFDYEGLSDDEFGQFKVVYEAVCKEMERIGYEHIEDTESEESFEQECDANEYTFEENGKMRNV
mgnify:FL=1